MASQIPSNLTFVEQLGWANIKGNIKVSRITRSLWGGSTDLITLILDRCLDNSVFLTPYPISEWLKKSKYMSAGFETSQDVMITCLTHWGRVTHICVGKLTILGSDNGLSPGRRQAIIWTNAGILLIGPLGTNFSEILIKIHMLSFMKMYLKISSAKWCLFCLSLNELMWFRNWQCVYARYTICHSSVWLCGVFTCCAKSGSSCKIRLFLLILLSTNVNSLAPGKFKWNFRHVIFKEILVIDGWGISCEIALIVTGLHWWWVNTGSGNGLVLSGNKPLLEPMLTQISVAIWCH